VLKTLVTSRLLLEYKGSNDCVDQNHM
jgi:hypothetical protein